MRTLADGARTHRTHTPAVTGMRYDYEPSKRLLCAARTTARARRKSSSVSRRSGGSGGSSCSSSSSSFGSAASVGTAHRSPGCGARGGVLGGAAAPGREALTTISMRMYKARLDAWTGGDWGLFQSLLRTLRAIADRHATTVANVAAAWVLHQLGPDGGWVIIGVRDDSHLIEHKALRDLVLDAEDAAKINEVLAEGAAPVGDIWSDERGG